MPGPEGNLLLFMLGLITLILGAEFPVLAWRPRRHIRP